MITLGFRATVQRLSVREVRPFAGRWTLADGTISIPFAAGRGLSGDGSTIVGQSTFGAPNQAIR